MKSLMTTWLGLLLAIPALAQNPALDPVELEAFLDGVVAEGMDTGHLPGVTIAVVHDGQMVLAKGWGFADIENGLPVRADETLFRIGSVSKTMTFTAVMQLVEQGKLDLDADLHDVLNEVSIEDTHGELSMIHLMSHTPGYEDLYLGHFVARDTSQDYELADYLNRFPPSRVRAPGDVTSYSNYGVALAGQVVAELSGETFEDYMDNSVFAPLGMSHTSFREDYDGGQDHHLSADLAQQRARGYTWTRGAFKEVDPYYMHRGMAPAGSVSATATDMARWMLFHLGHGQSGPGAVLQPETLETMHAQAFANQDGAPGNAHGFWTNHVHGYETREHGGAIFGALTDMVLIPELDLGIFASTNGDSGRSFVTSLSHHVVGEFFPSKLDLTKKPHESFKEIAQNYTGTYQGNRRGFTTMDKLGALGNSLIEVTTDDEGYLYTGEGDGAEQWLPLGEHRFASTRDGRIMSFRVDENGRATHQFGDYGHTSAPRVSFWRSDTFVFLSITLSVLGFLLAFNGAWYRRGRNVQQTNRQAKASLLLLLTGAVWLFFLLGFALGMSGVGGSVPAVLFEFPDTTTVVMLWVGILAALLTLIGLLMLPGVWKDGNWTFRRRLFHSAVVLSSVAMAAALWDWRVLGFHYF